MTTSRGRSTGHHAIGKRRLSRSPRILITEVVGRVKRLAGVVTLDDYPSGGALLCAVPGGVRSLCPSTRKRSRLTGAQKPPQRPRYFEKLIQRAGAVGTEV